MAWNETGDMLLSGSDDCFLNIYRLTSIKVLDLTGRGRRNEIRERGREGGREGRRERERERGREGERGEEMGGGRKKGRKKGREGGRNGGREPMNPKLNDTKSFTMFIASSFYSKWSSCKHIQCEVFTCNRRHKGSFSHKYR